MLTFFNNYFAKIKTPHFWERDGLIPQLLIPFTLVYFISKRLVEKNVEPKKFKANIITVGNPIAGGAGKTPTSIALYNLLQKNFKGKKICFLSKGYGGKVVEPRAVDLLKDNAVQVGDEPILLASIGDTIVSNDRLKGIEFAESLGFDFVITDDGLHDNRFEKILNIAVIDGSYGLGNRLVIPSGPLRDRIDLALKNVKNIFLIGEDKRDIVKYIKRRTRRDDFKVFSADIEVTSKHDKDNIYLAFAGIARPGKFFETLNESGLFVSETVEFPDHRDYTEEDVEYLTELSKDNKAKLITTEKDFVKLPESFREQVECVRIKYKFAKEKEVVELVKQAIRSRS